jgi:hypothetical protein
LTGILRLLVEFLIWILALLAALVRIVSHRSISTLVSSPSYSGVLLRNRRVVKTVDRDQDRPDVVVTPAFMHRYPAGFG